MNDQTQTAIDPEIIGELDFEIQNEIMEIEEKFLEFKQISTIEQAESAKNFGKKLKDLITKVEQKHKPKKDLAFAAHRKACDEEKSEILPIKNIFEQLDSQIKAFNKREADRVRIANEKLMLEQKKANELATKKAIEDAETKGDFVEAEIIASTPALPIAPIVTQEKLKGSGIKYKLKYLDKKAFIFALKDTPEPLLTELLEMIEVKQSAMSQWGNRIKKINPFPGVFFEEEEKQIYR